MKRVKAACLEQTLHFQLKDGVDPGLAKQQIKEEYETYKLKMDRMNTKYRILSESEQPDGSLMIKIKKQVNAQPVGDYLD